MPPRCLLTLDVSSEALGWALHLRDEPPPKNLVFARLAPPSRLPAHERIDAIVDHVVWLCREARPDVVVMEWTDGRTDVARAKGRGRMVAGLAVLGQAQGAVRQALRTHWTEPELVNEAEWTEGQKKKDRAYNISLEFPAYAEFAKGGYDSGYDAADAIGLGLWWLARRKIEDMVAEANSPDAPAAHRGNGG